MRAAIYGNLAGLDKLVTYRTIIRCITFLNTQYISTGIMAGSWAANQPDFVSGGMTYKEMFSFWHSEIMRSMALLQNQKGNLRLPSCADFFGASF